MELLPAVVKAVEQLAPGDEMFGDTIRLAGLDLLSRLHIREGMALCVTLIEPGRWGAGKRLPKCLECITRYGTHARQVLPQLQEVRTEWLKTSRGEEANAQVQLLDQAISSIQNSQAGPTLVSVQEFKARPGQPR